MSFVVHHKVSGSKISRMIWPRIANFYTAPMSIKFTATQIWRHHLLPVGIYGSFKKNCPTALSQSLVAQRFAYPTDWWTSCFTTWHQFSSSDNVFSVSRICYCNRVLLLPDMHVLSLFITLKSVFHWFHSLVIVIPDRKRCSSVSVVGRCAFISDPTVDFITISQFSSTISICQPSALLYMQLL